MGHQIYCTAQMTFDSFRVMNAIIQRLDGLTQMVGELSAKIDAEIRRILEEQFERAESILTEHRSALDACAALLLKYERVTGEEFIAVYNGQDMDEVMQRGAAEEAKRDEETEQPTVGEQPKPETEQE